jgi:hypothetical protein
MSAPNIMQSTFDHFAKALGGRKKSGSWYIAGPDAVVVLNLQKSNYANKYYVNIGLWFTGVGPAKDPKPTYCHLQARAETLVDDTHRPRLEALLTVESDRPVDEHERDLLEALDSQIRPYIEAGQTLAGLTTSAGQRLLRKSMLDGDGQRFLSGVGVKP